MSADLNASSLVTIAFVPRERFSHTRRSLETLRRHTPDGVKFLIVDGGSPRHVARCLRSQAQIPGTRLIRTEHLLAPNEARNLAGRAIDTKYMLVVDNDVLVTPGWFEPLVAAAEEHGAALVSPVTLEGELEGALVHQAGATIELLIDGGTRRLHTHRPHTNRPFAEVGPDIQSRFVDLLEFHATLVRMDVFRQVGGGDEQLTSSRDHLDFCMRVAGAGGRIYLEAKSVVTHLLGPPFRWTDYPFYLLRWCDAWNTESLDHFHRKWDLTPDEVSFGERIGWLTRRRRMAMEEGLLTPIGRWLRRKRDGEYHGWARRLMDRLDRRFIRLALDRRQRALERGERQLQEPMSVAPVQLPAAPAAAPVAKGAGETNAAHVAMFHIGRCGSTVLGDMLDQHPSIHWDGEIYEPGGSVWKAHGSPQEAADPIGFLRKRIGGATRPRYGCEVKFYQARLVNLPMEVLVSSLAALGFKHFIVLTRRNYLRKVVSSLVARASSRWHVPAGAVATLQRVRINVDAVGIDHGHLPLMELLRGYDADLAQVDALLAHRPVLKLVYEEDIEQDPRAAYRKVCAFIGEAMPPVNVRLDRTTPFPLREIIENYSEVAACLRGTPYEWMIDG